MFREFSHHFTAHSLFISFAGSSRLMLLRNTIAEYSENHVATHTNIMWPKSRGFDLKEVPTYSQH
jgi:hypothetical protein